MPKRVGCQSSLQRGTIAAFVAPRRRQVALGGQCRCIRCTPDLRLVPERVHAWERVHAAVRRLRKEREALPAPQWHYNALYMCAAVVQLEGVRNMWRTV